LISLPPRVYVNEPGSFAEFTVRKRLPAILQHVLRQNAYPPEIRARLSLLEDELAGGLVQPFEDAGPDCAFWQESWQLWRGKSWYDLPWLWAETFFYRRLLHAVHYFDPGSWYHLDPFASTKKQALELGLIRLPPILQLASTFKQMRFWLLSSLWSNRADFSNRAALANAQLLSQQQDDMLLIDDSVILEEVLEEQDLTRLDIICDNAGPELLTDLAFADLLLRQRYAAQVVLHLKAQPCYVSDAMPDDVIDSISALLSHPNADLASLGNRLQDWLDSRALLLQAHSFWTSCLTLCEIPSDLWRYFARSSLILFKGDVNYRRLLDDRHWPFETDLASIPNQVPVNYAVLRAIKSELACGLDTAKIEKLRLTEPDWMINGRWGFIQYVTRSLLG